MGFGDSTHDREPQARTAVAGSASAAVGPVKPLEHTVALDLGDAGPVVTDDEADAVGCKPGHVEVHEAVVLICVLDRVAGEIPQRLGEAVRVGLE